ncbi:MAG: multidrug efflux RND transporter permease subunit [Thermodesulfobacteriota bacterium]
MNISAHFINRPVATTLLTIGLALAGGISFHLLPVSPLPRVDFPTIQVSATLPGADPETMATSVAAPLERQFGQIAGVSEMTSTSSRGSTNIVLQFDLSRNIDGAARDVQAAINAARGYLPPNLPSNPTYRKVNPADAPILIIALTSDSVSTPQMYDAASSILQQKLSQIEGVGQVFVGGSSLPAVRVDVNPTALNKYGISLEGIRTVLARTNVNRPKGQLADETKAWEIQTNDQLRTAEQYRSLIVAFRSGQAVRLPDVATVADSVEDLRVAGLVNGRPAVVVVVFRQPGANIIETVDRVRSLLPQMENSLSGGIRLSVVLDRTPPIRGSLRDVELTLLVSSALVILVVFGFLRDIRSTVIPAVAVAVSLIGTFHVMWLLGYNLDNLSLMALTIATGFVVDDAIVVLENITRYIEKGKSAREAALTGAREIAFTVLSMSASLVAVFIPILLMGGMVGRLFHEFAVTLSVAVVVSLVISLTTTPMMCAALLRPRKNHTEGSFLRASEGFFEGMRRLYDRGLRRALRHPRFMLSLTLLTLGINIVLFIVVPKGFFPEQDTGRISGMIQAEQDISFQAMRDKLTQVVEIIRSDPDVDSVSAFTGGGGGSTANTGRMFIGLRPFGERKATAGQVIMRLRGKLLQVPGAPTYLQPVQDLRIGGMISTGLYQYTLQGDNLKELNTWAPQVLQRMRTLPQLIDVNSNQQDKGLQASVLIDRSTASRLRITPQLIDDTLYDAFGQRQVSITYSLLNQYHVVMEVEPGFWQRPETLRDIYVGSTTGAMVPLSAFTRLDRTATSLAVNHESQFPAVTISFNLLPGVSLGDAVKAVETATRQMGLPASIQGSFLGTAQAFKASLANEPLLILAALVAVYIVLGVLYESYVHPITILSTLPSAGVGAVLALLVFRAELSIIAVIGIILLIGLVKKNGIMMVDFALEAERRESKSPMEAIYQASLLRFRPIMMTTLAALLGALPLALGGGVGSELRRPLGIAIAGGLIISQMLTLFTTPVIYLYLDRLRLWLKGRRGQSRPGVAVVAMIVGAATLFSGCKVGPNYVKPDTEVPTSYKEAEGWKRAQPGDHLIRGAWWEIFNDPELSALEVEINISNQNVAGAEARFRQALAVAQAARSAFFPTVTVGTSVVRSSRSTTLSQGEKTKRTTSTDYLLPGVVSWELDVWGRVRRLAEAGTASAQASAADIETIRLSVQAELAQNYFLLRALDGQKQLLEETITAYQKTLELTRNRYSGGVVSKVDVLQAEAQLKTTQAQALDVGVQRAQLEHAIALLCGRPPSALPIPVVPLRGAPPAIPVGVPSDLLERRPDIASAERLMAAANAEIGVAVAGYFPAITLSASGGYETINLSKWLSWPSHFWALGATMAETVFQGGLRRAQTAQARATYDATVAFYRETVLTGFQEVEDNLAALRILEEEAQVQDEAVKAAQQSVTVALNQYKAGTASYLNVLVTQTLALNSQRTSLDILSRRMTATVLLIKALGGGWDESALRPADNPLEGRVRPGVGGQNGLLVSFGECPQDDCIGRDLIGPNRD